MARIFTTPAAEQAAKSWFHDLTLAAGINTNNLRSYTPQMTRNTLWQQAASTICDEIVNRDFNNIDAAINRISGIRFSVDGKWKTFKQDAIAKAIVYVAEIMQLYWDDTIRTPYEIDEFKKTFLGDAVFKYGRYISAIKDKTSKSRSSSASKASASGGSSGSTAKQQPKNGYYQSGPQSGNARDLQGNPGEKVRANTSLIYRIIGDTSTSKSVPQVFVNPISASGAAGKTNKVKFSSGKGYGDCTCYFDDENDAKEFLDKVIKNNRVPADVSNPRVVKRAADPNGYFLVGTEFGVCAIDAKRLNETLEEEAKNKDTRLPNWEKATEGYTKEELDELHTWMRRG